MTLTKYEVFFDSDTYKYYVVKVTLHCIHDECSYTKISGGYDSKEEADDECSRYYP